MAASNRKIITSFVVLSLIYLLITLLIPPDQKALTKYQLSTTEIKFLSLTIALPVIFIWMLGAFVYTKFRTYVDRISEDKDGKAFNFIVTGLLWIFLWLPISSIFSNIATYLYRNNPQWTAGLVIAVNFVNLIMVLVGFAYLYKGSQDLTKFREIKDSFKLKYWAYLPTILFSGLFIYLTMTNPVRQFPSAEVAVAGYYLSDWLLVSLIVIPYIFVFYFGFSSAVNIYLYRKKVRGVIYKDALNYLAKGLICIVLSVIFIRYLASLATVFNEATLKFVLLILYLLLGVLLLGFILLAKSVKRLEKIEKI